MPWCGFWGTTGGSYWWVLPLIGLVCMGVMFFVCFRRFGWMGRGWRGSGEPPELRHDVESLKEDVRKLQRRPS